MLTSREAAKWLSAARPCPELPALQTLREVPARLKGCGAAWKPLAISLMTVLSLRAEGQSSATNAVEVLVIQGTTEVARAGQSVWDLASTQKPYCRLNPGDQIRT